MSTNAQALRARVSSRFGPAFEALLERLYDSVNRGPLLKCFLTKTSASRVDISRFDIDEPVLDPSKKPLLVQYGLRILHVSSNDFVKWSKQMARDLGEWVRPYLRQVWAEVEQRAPVQNGLASQGPTESQVARLSSRLVDALISNESASISFQLDIASEVKEIQEQSIALYRALGQKISRSADLIRKEAGLRSLWLGYPLFLAHDLADPEKPSIVIAPLLLWAVDIQVSLSRQGQIRLSRDPKVGPPTFNRVLQRWVKTNLHFDFEETEIEGSPESGLTREQLDVLVRKITRGLSRVDVHPLASDLGRAPSKGQAEGLPHPAVLNSAVLGIFVSENQALIDNLEALRSTQEISEPLERLLSGKVEEHRSLDVPSEKDRYLVTDSDPFQEAAVWDSRHTPGTIIHGPPGTGKSQTIVNIVADTLAHGQTVLVVCQKRAAIDVVSQRIHAAGLSSLCTVAHDSEGDRRRVLLDLKEQIAAVAEYSRRADAAQRAALAQEIDKRESELDCYYKAVRLARSEIGLSYRTLVSRLGTLALAHPGLTPNPEIGELLSGTSRLLLESIVSNFRSIASLYKSAGVKDNPWRHRVSDFFLTANITKEIRAVISSCAAADAEHAEYVSVNGIGLRIDNLDGFEDVAQEADRVLLRISGFKDLTHIGRWVKTPEESRRQLEGLLVRQRELSRLAIGSSASRYVSLVRGSSPEKIQELSGICSVLLSGLEATWLRRALPGYRRAKRRLCELTRQTSADVTQNAVSDLRRECLLALKRREIDTILASVGWISQPSDGTTASTEYQLAQAIAELSCANAIGELPPDLRGLIAAALEKGRDAITQTILMVSNARHRVPLLLRLREELKKLRHWITTPYLHELSAKACAGEALQQPLSQLSEYLPKMPELVAFDSAKNSLGELESRLLSCLVSAGVPTPDWESLLEISALCRWAENCLSASPELKSMSPSLYNSRRAALAQALKKKRELESPTIMDFWAEQQCSLKELRPSPLNVLRSQLVTRGPNSKRLREVIGVGVQNGIFALRPCWLTNPNTACQIFGLTPGLFDVVIFDEASQCPVEQAVPIVQRGKRVVVSGDEKQLPPTSFFLSFSGSSFEPDGNLPTESELSDEEIAERALEKQILNSKDLLTVCQPLLRSSYLDMHYRSEHPSLIEFSNHAFYGGRLQFPPARPTDAQTPPIEYREVSGIYESNQNRDEAKSVIELLQQIWKEEPCPTVGVVTFNAQQRDLIENLVQEKAIADADFRLRYESESAREDGRQQVGFFVKNLESVQGDERDVMIFSTTFGRDNTGAFKRFFGPINLEGGERRLNVAVTRAKKKVYVLTSMPVFEISDAFSSTGAFGGQHITGREYLQGYLLYSKAISDGDAARASEILKRARELGFEIDNEGHATSIDFESEFEIAVYEALRSRGITLDTQVGVAGFRIDLAVRHPDPSKGYLMGIECDGKAFHSSFSARARDIWREQILRSRGWRIHRIWSSDWWADPEFEVQKVIEAIQGCSA